MRLLYDHDHREGDALVRDLIERGVITDSGNAKLYCLNFVSVWGSAAASFIVGLPVFFGLLCCIIWPIVAVCIYNADVQTSVQTGFAVGSFVVTAGAWIGIFIKHLYSFFGLSPSLHPLFNQQRVLPAPFCRWVTNDCLGALLIGLVTFLDAVSSNRGDQGVFGLSSQTAQENGGQNPRNRHRPRKRIYRRRAYV